MGASCGCRQRRTRLRSMNMVTPDVKAIVPKLEFLLGKAVHTTFLECAHQRLTALRGIAGSLPSSSPQQRSIYD